MNIKKLFKPFSNFMDMDAQKKTLGNITDGLHDFRDDERTEITKRIIKLLDNVQDYDVNVSRLLVFVIQHMQTNGYLSIAEKVNANKKLYELIHTDVFKKKYAFSNAVSLTLREFVYDDDFPIKNVKNSFDYIIQEMDPISRGFGSRRCQVCWNKTLNDYSNRLDIKVNKELKNKFFEITRLNIFRDQLNESYDEKMNELTNNLYRRIFKNIKTIDVHNTKSDNSNVIKKNKQLQKQGIDKTIHLRDGKKIFIEEKFRTYAYWDHRKRDILLEYMSIDNKNIPGWVYTSKSDYLVIVFQNLEIEDSEVYIFPFKPIKKWVRENKQKFMSYLDLSAPNITWNTLSKAVPLEKIKEILIKTGHKDFTEIFNIKIKN